jgi:hypothetical protein
MQMNNNKMVSERKRKLFLGAVVVVLAIIAIVGYAFEKKKEPLRVAFATQGGGVIFDHKVHVSLKNTHCSECHHNYAEGEKGPMAMNCRACHYSKEYRELVDTESIHKRLIGKNCIGCHEQDSVNCVFCHNAENFSPVKKPEKVEFYTDGGPVVFDHSAHASAEGYGLECDSCHHDYKPGNKNSFPLNCRRCHYNKKYATICEKEDTHTRCIAKNCLVCHSDFADACEKCHKE